MKRPKASPREYVGQVLGSDGRMVGSCFLTGPATVLTAAHVLHAAHAHRIGDDVTIAFPGIEPLRTAAVVRAVDEKRDLAALESWVSLPATAPELASADLSAEPALLTLYSFLQGRKLRKVDMHYRGKQTELSATRALPSLTSGAPVVRNVDGLVVGMLLGVRKDEKLHNAWSDDLRQFLSQNERRSTKNATRGGEIFVSHGTDETLAAQTLSEMLERYLGPGSVSTAAQIRVGERWHDQLVRMVDRASTVLIVIGPQWRLSPWIEAELRDVLARTVQVIPVLWGGARLPSPKSLPADLRRLLAFQAAEVELESLADDVYRLASQIREIAPVRLPALEPKDEISTDDAHSDLELISDGADSRGLPLISLRGAGGRAGYPAFQFDDNRRPIDLVLRINEMLGAEEDPEGVLDWWLGPNVWLNAPPVALLSRDDEARLLAAARAALPGED
ncbi:toll/interleukin-1 receptor domain-containing protein [Paractinoplanes rishiriensis]|uniref:TIR domain-containing protein n=1 Tax=Paractinoplanes rishiriensis TaxID=1050105 RepID=A0A919JZ06_9ACTN|nr:toll/interleukin-1 receptor domain-containing protein [Actinoplanes rishiriensis]GIE95892.1 hypothetical protein Ari01nite_33570 [Actinoplanes rishiriensis]